MTDGHEIIIKDGRHPVVEQFVKDSYFVPNDVELDTKKNRSVEGTGLGLNITKQLTELMGGRIEVESEVKKGTVFTFFFEKVKGNLDEFMEE